MIVLKLVMRTLFSGKIGRVTIVAIASFALSFLIGLVSYTTTLTKISSASLSIISNIFLGIGTSILAASLITVFEKIQIISVDKLMKLFSVRTSRKTIIVIPQFDKNYFDVKESGDSNFTKKTPNEISFISYADFSTAKYLVSLFQQHQLGIPEIMTDGEMLNLLKDNTQLKRYQTVISLGLYSNLFSEFINQQELKHKYFRFDARLVEQPGERKLYFKEIIKENVDQWDVLTPNNQSCSDLCIYTKLMYEVTKKSTLNITILGGLNATGTSLIGGFIYNNWKTLISQEKARSCDYQVRNIIEQENFCLIYKINGKLNVRYDEEATLAHDPIRKRI
jgi:hypothetical protein